MYKLPQDILPTLKGSIMPIEYYLTVKIDYSKNGVKSKDLSVPFIIIPNAMCKLVQTQSILN